MVNNFNETNANAISGFHSINGYSIIILSIRLKTISGNEEQIAFVIPRFAILLSGECLLHFAVYILTEVLELKFRYTIEE